MKSPAEGQLESHHRLLTSKDLFLKSNRKFTQDSCISFSTKNTTFLSDHYDLISSDLSNRREMRWRFDCEDTPFAKGTQDTFELRK